MSCSKAPCAACKTLRRKCTNECVFAPCFPPDQPERFESVHRVYGASNVTKILTDLTTATERAEAVTSLVYEAEARLKDPIYGCVGSLYILQHKLKRIQTEIQSTRQELAAFVGPSAMNTGFMPEFPNQHPSMIGSKLETSGDAYENQLVEEQDMHMLKKHQQQQQQQHHVLGYQQQLMDLWTRSDAAAGSSGHATHSDNNACGTPQQQQQPPQQVPLHHIQQNQSSQPQQQQREQKHQNQSSHP